MTNLVITNLEESTTLDQASMLDVRGGFFGAVILYAHYRAIKSILTDDDESYDASVQSEMPTRGASKGALANEQDRVVRDQTTGIRLGLPGY